MDHPNADAIWLADINLGNDAPPARIVFGGSRRLEPGTIVPVAPLGSRITITSKKDSALRVEKVRARTYRAIRSHGMLCSLDELGWLERGPDEVAILQNVTLGQSLDDIGADKYAHVVVEWYRAQDIARGPMVDWVAPLGAA